MIFIQLMELQLTLYKGYANQAGYGLDDAEYATAYTDA